MKEHHNGSGRELLSLLDTANPVELVELRLALEPVMCRLAALRSSRLDVERLRRQAELTSRADNFVTYKEADIEFHRLIGELSRNSVFVELQTVLSTALRDTALERFGENGHCFKRQAEHVAFHRRIVEAIAERDTDGAERLMQEHLSDVHRSIFADVIPLGLDRDKHRLGRLRFELPVQRLNTPRTYASNDEARIWWEWCSPQDEVGRPFPAIAMTEALMFPLIIPGITDASTTRRASIPFTRSSGSTHAFQVVGSPHAAGPERMMNRNRC